MTPCSVGIEQGEAFKKDGSFSIVFIPEMSYHNVVDRYGQSQRRPCGAPPESFSPAGKHFKEKSPAKINQKAQHRIAEYKRIPLPESGYSRIVKRYGQEDQPHDLIPVSA